MAALTSAEREMLQERQDRIDRMKAEEAYNASLTNTEAAPKKSSTVKKARGGYVKSADGVAKRGKTKGKLC